MLAARSSAYALLLTGASCTTGTLGTLPRDTTGGVEPASFSCDLDLEDLVDLVVISERTCVASAQCLRCWGNNFEGRLGLGHTSVVGDEPGELRPETSSVDIGLQPGERITGLGGGPGHTCAIIDGTELACWGDNSAAQLGIGTSDAGPFGDEPGELGDARARTLVGGAIRGVTGGTLHTCAHLDSDAIRCWGSNKFGSTGTESIGVVGDEIDEVTNTAPVNLGAGVTVTVVGSGRRHLCAQLSDDRVKCWGTSNKGQLGQGHSQDVGLEPGQMGDALPYTDLGPSSARLLAVGATHSCAQLSDDTIRCWGAGERGELGHGEVSRVGTDPAHMGDALTPVPLPAASPVTHLEAGEDFSCALLQDGDVMCWGNNDTGISGVGHGAKIGDAPGEIEALEPVDLGPRKVRMLARSISSFHMCAQLDDLTIRCWGSNASGQLGVGHTNNVGDQPDELGEALAAAISP